MKKIIICLLSLFLLQNVCFAKEFNNIEIVDAFFDTDIQNYTWIKGLWVDKNNIAQRIMYEDIYCNFYNSKCTSAFSEIDFLGANIENPPFFRIYNLEYKIIKKTGNNLKIYCDETEYFIEINLNTKTATKYKIFSNKDVNMYYFMFDANKSKSINKKTIGK